jgi:ribosome-binding protein aMBF1 (putative translation factor)
MFVKEVSMARITELHRKWMKEPKYRKAYDSLEDEFAVAKAVIAARNRAGLTQTELARKMGTTQPVVARMEGGRIQPSLRTLKRLADATGSRLMIRFEPDRGGRSVG